MIQQVLLQVHAYLPSFSCLLTLSLLEEKCPFCVFTVFSIYGRLNRAFWVNFSKFFSRSLSTRGGFSTLPNEDLAGFTPCVCIFAPVLLAFGPFMMGRRMPVFRALPCIFASLAYKQYLLGGPLPFRWPSAPKSCPHALDRAAPPRDGRVPGP